MKLKLSQPNQLKLELDWAGLSLAKSLDEVYGYHFVKLQITSRKELTSFSPCPKNVKKNRNNSTKIYQKKLWMSWIWHIYLTLLSHKNDKMTVAIVTFVHTKFCPPPKHARIILERSVKCISCIKENMHHKYDIA